MALADRSDLARLVGDGPDLLPLLHRLSTAAVATLVPGRGRQTVLTSNKGRIVARLFVYRRERDVLLVGGPGGRTAAAAIRAHVDRYTIAERTGLCEADDEAALLALVGPRADDVLERLGLPRPAAGGCAAGTLEGRAVTVLDGDGVAQGDGRRALVVEGEGRAGIEAAVREAGGAVVDAETLEALRIADGLPQGGHELTEAYNPLEAGLWEAVDFDKGCYVGQEVVARLRTYDKVSRALVRLELERTPGALPAPLALDGREVGALTSASGTLGLGYVKRKALAPALELALPDGASARVVGPVAADGPRP